MKRGNACLAIACLVSMSHAFARESRKDAGNYKGKIKAEVLLDEETGLVTWLLRNTSSTTVRIHMKSVEEAEIDLSIQPNVDLGKVEIHDDDRVDPEEGVEFPYGMDASYRVAGAPRPEKPKLDRVVDLKKGEAVSKSFLIWEAPWWEKLVSKLEKRKHKEYRIHPRPTIYTADEQGKPVRDHHISVWVMERGADGKLGAVFKTKGFTIDLKLARKLRRIPGSSAAERANGKHRIARSTAAFTPAPPPPPEAPSPARGTARRRPRPRRGGRRSR